MSAAPLSQLGLLLIEALIVSVVLLGLFSLRRLLGLSLMYMTLGVFQFMQNLLAAAVYVEVAPGLAVSAGSVVLFTASFFGILLVYIKEDALEARKLCYGLVAANLVMMVIMYITGLSLSLPGILNFYDLPADLFIQRLRGTIAGTAALVLDVVFVILLYEAVSRWIRRALFLRIAVTMILILAFDTVFFVTGAFAGQPEFAPILKSALLGKSVAAILYSAVLTVYLRRSDRGQRDTAPKELADVFHLLTFRQKYEVLSQQVTHDPLTGAHNRGFFDDVLKKALSLARRTGEPLALFMLDIDRFKSINDEHGHQMGDKALIALTEFLLGSLRESDIVCRYGGEEFAVILPRTDGDAAAAIARKLRGQLAQLQLTDDWAAQPLRFTVTCGVASTPEDTEHAEELVTRADQRLYDGKQAGRDRVVWAGGLFPA